MSLRRRPPRPAFAVLATLALAACQPARPTTGPGSTEGYVASAVDAFTQGAQTPTSSTKVTWYVPDVLKHGASAPVVVFLHGFAAGDPALYGAHIDHIARQGNLVIFPAYNTSNLLNDLDQNVMVDRMVANTQDALDALGAVAELAELFVYGHSAGAAFGSVWQHNGGATPAGLVLAHPSIDLGAIPVPVPVVPVDFAAEAPSTTAPVVLMTGNADTIAAPQEAVDLHGYLTGAPSRVVWQALSDATMFPPIVADHIAPNTFGGQTDTLDWRFYWAALDQMMAGTALPTFDFGNWLNGAPVAGPVLLAN